MWVFSTYSLFDLQNLASISVYSTAKLFGCIHFCIVSIQAMVSEVVLAIVSFYVKGMLTSCWPFLPEIASPPLQSRSWKILNMDNEPYSTLMDRSMCLSKVTCKLKCHCDVTINGSALLQTSAPPPGLSWLQHPCVCA